MVQKLETGLYLMVFLLCSRVHRRLRWLRFLARAAKQTDEIRASPFRGADGCLQRVEHLPGCCSQVSPCRWRQRCSTCASTCLGAAGPVSRSWHASCTSWPSSQWATLPASRTPSGPRWLPPCLGTGTCAPLSVCVSMSKVSDGIVSRLSVFLLGDPGHMNAIC